MSVIRHTENVIFKSKMKATFPNLPRLVVRDLAVRSTSMHNPRYKERNQRRANKNLRMWLAELMKGHYFPRNFQGFAL